MFIVQAIEVDDSKHVMPADRAIYLMIEHGITATFAPPSRNVPFYLDIPFNKIASLSGWEDTLTDSNTSQSQRSARLPKLQIELKDEEWNHVINAEEQKSSKIVILFDSLEAVEAVVRFLNDTKKSDGKSRASRSQTLDVSKNALPKIPANTLVPALVEPNHGPGKLADLSSLLSPEPDEPVGGRTRAKPRPKTVEGENGTPPEQIESKAAGRPGGPKGAKRKRAVAQPKAKKKVARNLNRAPPNLKSQSRKETETSDVFEATVPQVSEDEGDSKATLKLAKSKRRRKKAPRVAERRTPRQAMARRAAGRAANKYKSAEDEDEDEYKASQDVKRISTSSHVATRAKVSKADSKRKSYHEQSIADSDENFHDSSAENGVLDSVLSQNGPTNAAKEKLMTNKLASEASENYQAFEATILDFDPSPMQLDVQPKAERPIDSSGYENSLAGISQDKPIDIFSDHSSSVEESKSQPSGIAIRKVATHLKETGFLEYNKSQHTNEPHPERGLL